MTHTLNLRFRRSPKFRPGINPVVAVMRVLSIDIKALVPQFKRMTVHAVVLNENAWMIHGLNI